MPMPKDLLTLFLLLHELLVARFVICPITCPLVSAQLLPTKHILRIFLHDDVVLHIFSIWYSAPVPHPSQ